MVPSSPLGTNLRWQATLSVLRLELRDGLAGPVPGVRVGSGKQGTLDRRGVRWPGDPPPPAADVGVEAVHAQQPMIACRGDLRAAAGAVHDPHAPVHPHRYRGRLQVDSGWEEDTDAALLAVPVPQHQSRRRDLQALGGQLRQRVCPARKSTSWEIASTNTSRVMRGAPNGRRFTVSRSPIRVPSTTGHSPGLLAGSRVICGRRTFGSLYWASW